MSGLYHWDDERMADWKMKEIQREITQANLLREAGLSGTDWLAYAINALRNLLRMGSRNSQDHNSIEPQSYPPHSEKAAQ